jgi:hypothetical protein
MAGGYGAPPPAQAGYGAPSYGAPSYGGPPAPAAGFNPASVNPLDWGILGVGFLVLIFSFFSYYKATASGIVSVSQSYSAWHDIFGGGFFGWLGIIVAVAGAVIVALELFMPTAKLPVPARLLALGLFALGFVLELLAIVAHPKFASESGLGFKVSFGHGFSFWIELILTLAGTVLCFLRLQATGGKLPWEKGPTGPAAPPTPGYGPPM